MLAEVDDVSGMDAVEGVTEEYDRMAAVVLLCVAHRMHSEEGGDPEGSVSNDEKKIGQGIVHWAIVLRRADTMACGPLLEAVMLVNGQVRTTRGVLSARL